MLHLISHPLSRQFVKFCIIGLSNFTIDIVIYVGLTRSFDFWKGHYLLANMVSFCIAVIWSYYWNKRWTFRDGTSRTATQFGKFVFVVLIGLGLAELFLWGFVEQFHIYDILAKFIAAVVIAFWNFGMNKFWTFNGR